MTPTTADLELFFKTNVARLDRTICELTGELEALRERQILRGDSFASRLELARHTADEVRNKVTDLARELGREVPPWSDRASLEAVVRELLAARAGHAQARERLQRVAGQLEEGRFVHKIRRTAERLNAARLKAAAEMRQQASAAQPDLFSGPDDGSDWLTWAWSLEPAHLDQLAEQLQAAYPTLADLLPEAERWQPGASPSPAPGAGPDVFVPPFPPESDPALFHPREPPTAQAPPAKEVPAALVEAPPSLTAADSVSAASLVVEDEETKALKAEPAPPSAPVVATPAPEPPSAPPLAPAPQDSHEQATRSVPRPTILKGSPVSQEPEVAPDEVVGVVHSDAPALDPGRFDADQKLIWLLLEQDRPGFAYHLATCLQRLARGAACLPAALPYAIALNPLVSSSGGEVVENLRDCISNLQDYVTECEAEQGEEAHAVRVLLLVGMLRPALLAPSSTAGSLLATLVDGESPLALLGRAVLDYTSHGQVLTPALLSGVRAQAAWEDTVRQACEAARTWLVDNRQSHLIYAHTTTVWREWLRDGGILGRPLSFLITDDRTHAEEVRDAVKSWSLKRDVDNRLARTDKQLRKGGARQRPIIARAQTAVFERAQEFVALAQRWLDLIAAEASDANDYRFRQAEECRGRLQALLNPAQQAVNKLGTAPGDHVALRAASAVSMRLLNGLAQLIDPDAQEGTGTPPLRYVLHRELLGLPWLTLNERWEPEEADVERLLSELERQAAMEAADLRQAFAARVGARDHRATGWVLDALAWAGVPESELQELRAQDEQKLQQCRLALRRKLEETRDNIERAVCYDLIDEPTRSDYLARVENVAVEEVMVFGPEEAQLGEIDETLATSRTKRIREVEQNPAMATIAREHSDAHARIQEALHRQDFLTAEEYIRLTQAGQTLDGVAVQGRDILREFFPDFTGQWHNLFSGAGSRAAPDLRQVRENVRSGRSVGPLSMGGVPAPQAREAANMLEAWFRLKERSRTPKDHLRDLLSTFGFKVHDVQPTDGGEDSHWLADVRTEPLADRADCLVPQFGSLAKGQYRVLCLNERLSEDRMIDLARKYSPHGPLLVLYLGRMTDQRRRDLAEMCWRKHRTFLVIDEAMVFFLCGERFKRLPVLFACAFPFTVAEPYTTTSSLVLKQAKIPGSAGLPNPWRPRRTLSVLLCEEQ